MDVDSMEASEAKLPLHEDIMQLARLGEVAPIRKLFDEGKYKANHTDSENITPLHWAAINNHYVLCQGLINHGAVVDAIGGESQATPAQWAVQRCHYYTVNLLLRHGADPTIADGGGYKMIHLATFDGNVFMLLLILLHPNVSIDEPDAQGHTALMWAAYNRLPAVVELLIRFGASTSATDETGFTPLHWALVRGSGSCVLKLLENGADRFAVTSTEKTPAVVAEEMKTTHAWHRALKESGFNDDATSKRLPLPYLSFIKKRVFWILSHMVIYAAIPISFLCAYCLQWAAQQVLLWAPSDMKHLHKTPYLAGIFAGSLFWVTMRWVLNVLPATFASNVLPNIGFGICVAFCGYFYTYAMIQDPGFVPKLGSRSQQKYVVYELMSLWKFDDENFCTICMLRKPLRTESTGPKLIKAFYLYIFFGVAGIPLFIRLVLAYLESLPPPPQRKCNLLSEEPCNLVLRDPFTVVLAIWCTLQFMWMVMLFIVQSVQIARGLTTWESMRTHVHDSTPATKMVTSAITAGTTSLSAASLTNAGMGPDPAIGPGPPDNAPARKQGYFAQWQKLLGLDTFIATATGRSGRRKRGNPFSRGIVTNCRDFWFDPAPYFGRRENGAAMLDGEVINYTRMYETPSRMRISRELSQVALRYKVNKATAKDLLKCLEKLKATLQAVSRFLDTKLADYVFFPLSHIFGESQRLSSRILELALHCLHVLITQGWRDQLSSEVGKQLLILLAYLAGGSATDAKCKDVDEDVSSVAFDCTTALFQSAVASSLGDASTIRSENIPLLGHAITVVLDGISDGSANKVRQAACDALKALIAGVQDQEALRNFFPGIVSCLTKVLSSGIRSKTSYKVLERCIQSLEQVLCKVLGREGPSSSKPASGASKEAPKAGTKWMEATSSQVEKALSTIIPLRYHDREEVLDALFSLCISILTKCRTALAGCAPLMVETLTTLSSNSMTENTNPRCQQLQQLLASDPDLVEMLREALQDSIVALPRVVGSNDETKRRRVIEQLSTAFRLLFAQDVDLGSLKDLTVSNLQSSVAAMVHASPTRTISSVADGSVEIGRVLQSATTMVNRRTFAPVVLDPTSQAGAIAGLHMLAKQLQASAMSTAIQQRLAASLRTSSGNEQIGSLWLTLQLLETNSLQTEEMDQWLNIPSDDFDAQKDDVYSFALEVLENSTYDDAVDWRLQALSLEVVALQARSQARDFRPELVDTLYPILERMGSSNAALQQHAVTCLSIVSSACGYPSASQLVTDNADYLLDAVAFKLNQDDISPQASQVILMMVRLCGSPLIPYLDDLIESIFAILASHHGYPPLVESLFEILNAVVEEASKSSPLAIESGTKSAPERRQPYKPITIAEIISRVQSMKRYPLETDLPELEPEREPDPEPDPETTPPPATSTDEPPPLSQTHSLIRTITLQTTHHLSSPSPTLRRLLLTLLTSSLPTLATQTPTDTFLPIIATIWPHIANPLFSTSSSSAIKNNDLPTLLVALTTLTRACMYGGSFLLSRVEDSFPALAGLYNHLERIYLLEEKQLGRSRASRSSKFRCWDACVGLVVAMVEYVGITREMEDGVFEILGREPLEKGRQGVRECLEGINADRLWLEEEERRFRSTDGDEYVKERWKKPVVQGWDFRDVQF
ncbi:MAG: hypothetical protein Q9207_004078 [Kuettlingeria erythrocarpa]